MSEPLARALLVVAVVALALLTGWLGRRIARRRAEDVPLDLTGLGGRVLFFTDSACRRCRVVRGRLDELGAEYTEIRHDQEPETHRRVGVTGVPLIVVRDAESVTKLAGVVSRRRLARALAASSGDG